MQEKTSWGQEASWYDDHLASEDTYHAQVITPNLKRLLDLKKDESVLEVGCGQGFFSRMFASEGALVSACDISPELIQIAKEKNHGMANPKYLVTPSHELSAYSSSSFDTVVIVLALQNIKEIEGTFKEVKRVLKDGGRMVIVLNHPCFRIPHYSSWGYDEEKKIQYRRVDGYLSESTHKIDMHPGEKKKSWTISFHRSLQVYIKSLSKEGFALIKLEEWISHRKSMKGPKQIAEDKARKEIPLFMCIETKSI
jgi:ubiquinone/menaquinone biosynthesis C-methylase UbiE